MKILIVGASGDVGQAAYTALSQNHDIITAGRSSGDIRVDISDLDSIKDMYHKTGALDAVISAVGNVHFAHLNEYTEETFMLGLQNKVMGQVNLVLQGFQHVNNRGSFTLTSGVLDRDPVIKGVSSATANAALAGFAKSAAIDMPKQQRINIVSPSLLDVSAPTYGALFQGHETVSSERVGLAYIKAVEGALSGQVIIIE